jgi:hypothetical protein
MLDLEKNLLTLSTQLTTNYPGLPPNPAHGVITHPSLSMYAHLLMASFNAPAAALAWQYLAAITATA